MGDKIEKLDRKFYGSIFKAKNGGRVPDDQYVVFLAKDNAFRAILPAYREECEKLGCDAKQIQMVDDLIERIDRWRAAHPDLCKVPDAAGEIILDETGVRLSQEK